MVVVVLKNFVVIVLMRWVVAGAMPVAAAVATRCYMLAVVVRAVVVKARAVVKVRVVVAEPLGHLPVLVVVV